MTLTGFGATRRCRSGISQGNIAFYPNAVSGEIFLIAGFFFLINHLRYKSKVNDIISLIHFYNSWAIAIACKK